MKGLSARLNTRPGTVVAFAIHLLLSVLAFSTLVVIMMLFWFPGELFFLDGGLEGLKLVALVDLVLGPALTLILYKPGKPSLRFDLSIIALVQLSALAYGFYTTHAQRTVAMVYAENRFMTLSARDHQSANEELVSLGYSPQQLTGSSFLTVPLVLTPKPDDYGQFLADILNGYPEPRARSDLFVPLDQGRSEMIQGRQTREQLEISGTLDVVNRALERRSMAIDDVEIYRFKARYASGVVAFDPTTQRIVDYVPVTDTDTKVDRPNMATATD